ncbi:MAG TPA: hypothetical protein VFV41_25210 [Streptosporangiaceae bacterium]|nr:hypothetical protein [Streptosporangiaceae bacterium]
MLVDAAHAPGRPLIVATARDQARPAGIRAASGNPEHALFLIATLRGRGARAARNTAQTKKTPPQGETVSRQGPQNGIIDDQLINAQELTIAY